MALGTISVPLVLSCGAAQPAASYRNPQHQPVGIYLTLGGPMDIRECRAEDLGSVLAIYNDVIATSTAIYAEAPTTLEDRITWWEARVRQQYPVLVGTDESGVIGFASFGDFRAWPGYRFTVEHSVHVRTDRRGQGVGTALVKALLPLASALGKHVIIAGIDADNAASIRMHERLGFVRVAHFKQVGFKFDRWLDLVFVQHFLDKT